MSTTYLGRPGNETLAASRTIINATATTPIEITTSAAHGFSTGEIVDIFGVLGVYEANGSYFVSVTASDKFTIYNGWTSGAPSGPVAGSGSWTTGGFATPTAIPRSFAAAETLPADGDDLTAASVNVALEANADRESWLLSRAGIVSPRVAQSYEKYVGGTVYTALTNANRVYTTNTVTGPAFTNSYQITNASNGPLYPVQPGNIIDASVTGTIRLSAVTLPCDAVAVRMIAQCYDYGAFSSIGTTIESAPVCIYYDAAYASAWFPFSLHLFGDPGISQGGFAMFLLQFYAMGGGGSATYSLIGPLSLRQNVLQVNY